MLGAAGVSGVESLASKLLLNRCEVAPDLLSGYFAVLDLEDMEQPKADRALLAIAEEWCTVLNVATPERLVDQEVIAVVAFQGRDALAAYGLKETGVIGANVALLRQFADW